MTIQELLNDYSGKVSYDKKFQEFDKVKKGQQAIIDQNNDIMSKFTEIVNEKGIIHASLYLAEQNPAIDPLLARKNFRNQLITEYQDYLLADDTARSHMDLEYERSYLLEQRESALNKHKADQAKMEVEQRFNKVREVHGISSEEEKELRADLMTDQLKGAYNIQKESDITPQILSDWHVKYSASVRARDLVDSFSTKSNSEWDDSQYNSVVNEIGNLVLSNPKHDDKFLADYLMFRYGKDENKEAVQRASKTVRETNEVRKQHDAQLDTTPDPDLADWLNSRF